MSLVSLSRHGRFPCFYEISDLLTHCKGWNSITIYTIWFGASSAPGAFLPLPVLNVEVFMSTLTKLCHFAFSSFLQRTSLCLSPRLHQVFFFFLSTFLAVSLSYTNVPTAKWDHTFSDTMFGVYFLLSAVELRWQVNIKNDGCFTGRKEIHYDFFPPYHTFTT